MPEVAFAVTGAHAVTHAAAPALALDLSVRCAAEVRSLQLQAQVRIDAPRRSYSGAEQAALIELFGEPTQWGRSLTGLLWANVAVPVRAFTGSTLVELPLPVSFELSLGVTKYFEAVQGGVPLTLLFSGTLFHGDPLQATLLPWSSEARFELPAALWRETLELHFPNRAALQVDRGIYERLRRFQLASGLPTVDRALEELLGAAS